jgi:putative transcriptional regulator
MTKKKKPSLADDIVQGLKNAAAFLEGKPGSARVHVPDAVNVKAIRRRLGMTQVQFCDAFGFDVLALREWEQGRRTPERTARAYLRVIAKAPGAVHRALAA